MYHKSLSYLNWTRSTFTSLNKSTKLINSTQLNEHHLNFNQAKLLTNSSIKLNFVDSNSDKIYELKFPTYDSNKADNQLTKLTNEDELSILKQKNCGLDLDPNTEIMERDFIRSIQPELPATFNLATYANHLDIIKQLVKLNVELYKIERDRELTKYLIRLDFNKDCIPILNFLIRCGFKRSELGRFLTKNFRIFQENLENLDKRIAYYEKMKFTKKEILEMMIDYPELISYSIESVDAKLGYIQRYLQLKPIFIRKMLLNCPRILKIDNVDLDVSVFEHLKKIM